MDEQEEKREEQRRISKSRNMMFISVLIVAVIYLLVTSGSPRTSLDVDTDNRTLTFSYSAKDTEIDPIVVSLDDVESVFLDEDLELGEMVSGVKNKSFLFGQWHNEEYGDYQLCSVANLETYAVLELKDGYMVFNYEGDDTTQELVKAIQELLDEYIAADNAA
ncbi:MAG: hypothetical protein ACI3VB_08555 [Oscillospiraceae bacterium]